MTTRNFMTMILLLAATIGCAATTTDPSTDGGTDAPDEGSGGSGGELHSSTMSAGTGGATVADEKLRDLCTATGGTEVALQCCIAQGAWQPTCTAPRCGAVLTCDAQGADALSMCECAAGSCFDPAKGCVPAR